MRGFGVEGGGVEGSQGHRSRSGRAGTGTGIGTEEKPYIRDRDVQGPEIQRLLREFTGRSRSVKSIWDNIWAFA